MKTSREQIRLRDWLEARQPPPPPALARRLSDIVGETRCVDADVARSLVDAAITAFPVVTDDRRSAIDLLAVDALITYAVEAAAASGGDIESAASQAMQRIAATGKQ